MIKRAVVFILFFISGRFIILDVWPARLCLPLIANGRSLVGRCIQDIEPGKAVVCGLISCVLRLFYTFFIPF